MTNWKLKKKIDISILNKCLDNFLNKNMETNKENLELIQIIFL